MNPDLATTAPPITSAATNLMVVLCAATKRGLPMPFVARVADYTEAIDLHFHTRAEVHTWATALDVAEVIHASHTHTDGINDTTTAVATWHDVPLTLVASVPRMPRSGVAS